MNEIQHLNRRAFLKTTAIAGGGLLLGFHLPWGSHVAAATSDDQEINAWLRIDTDDTVTIVVGQSEMGQGVHTALPMIVAEELEADWQKVRVAFAPVAAAYRNPIFHIQGTGGSTSVRAFYDPLRQAGAAVREMLVAAAAKSWGVSPGECRAEDGKIVHKPSGRKLRYGALAAAAAKLTPPANPALKSREQFRLIGKPTKRLDSPAKVDGSATFGLDVKVPGMLYAAVKASPVFGGKVASLNRKTAKAMAGVKAVVEIPDGVAVVAESYWQAKKALDAVEVKWAEGTRGTLESAGIAQRLRDGLRETGVVAHETGNVEEAFATAASVIEAEYDVPFLAHATMEPMNCTAHVRAKGCEIWAPTQGQERAQLLAAKLTGLPPDKVKVHTTFLGGGFGRRIEGDFVAQAVLLSKAVGTPVKVVWSREEDIQHDFYRPASACHLRGAFDAAGRLLGLTQLIVAPSIMARVYPDRVKDGLDHSSVEGSVSTPYGIPNRRVRYVMKDTGVPVGFWRSVGNSHNAFYVESFIDEIAHATRTDPYEFRRELLASSPRYRAVLEMAATKAGWGKPLPDRRFRGIALHESFGSIVAEVAEVSVSDEGRLRVHRVVCVVDCGRVVNPATVEAQMEGGIVYGLTAALRGEITLKAGRVVQSNFHDYEMLTQAEMPAVEVHILESGAALGGVGEPGTPPICAAVTNAIFAATGKRIRSLPIRKHDLRRA